MTSWRNGRVQSCHSRLAAAPYGAAARRVDEISLVLFGDSREGDDLPVLLFKDMADEVVLMKPLHNNGDGAATFVVEPAVERVVAPIVDRLNGGACDAPKNGPIKIRR